MANDNITLKISTPGKVVRNDEVYRVVVPSGKNNLTIIKGRAPASVFFDYGVISVLDKSDKYTDRYFVRTGVVDVAQDVCHISSEELIPFGQISAAQAKENMDTAPDDATKDFYAMVCSTLNIK